MSYRSNFYCITVLRPGDLARIDEGSTSSQAPRTKGAKAKSKDKEEATGVEGVVYKAHSPFHSLLAV